MKINLHQTHHTIADFKGISKYLQELFCTGSHFEGIHVFPELFLTGYPLQDLCLKKIFIKKYNELLDEINDWARNLDKDLYNTCIGLLGGIHYQLDLEGNPSEIKNVVYELKAGQKLKVIYSKQLLPNYDIFDEKKYFTPGNQNCIWEWNGHKIGLLICEDMWHSASYSHDPVYELKKYADSHGKELDLVINLSGSPFNLSKHNKRLNRAKVISHFMKVPFAYVNRVGGEDEVLFDGRSFIIQGDRCLIQGQAFKGDTVIFNFENSDFDQNYQYQDVKLGVGNSYWTELLTPQIKISEEKQIIE